MTQDFEVWYRDPRELIKNLLSNPDFDGEFDYSPFHEYDGDGNHHFQDFMSGDWAWHQADQIAKDPHTHGALFVPIIKGSDKTTVSVATGQNDYYPLYMSIGNIHNNVRCGHRKGVVLVGFLAVPKTEKKFTNDTKYRKFRRAKIMESLKSGMTTPEVMMCPDGHYCRVIYGFGPYIADYPEQAFLACIVQGWCPKCTVPLRSPETLGSRQTRAHTGYSCYYRCTVPLRSPETLGSRRTQAHTEFLVTQLELGDLWEEYELVGDVIPYTNDFPRADMHKMLSPDLLHQIIKGTFKDHLVTWVVQYLVKTHGDA
ncbi:hypothetical protein HWV62_26903 [Athelia sp. TMB]|nr:hypothetical protein HWV62_26903 [Athelia sp. TMB]